MGKLIVALAVVVALLPTNSRAADDAAVEARGEAYIRLRSYPNELTGDILKLYHPAETQFYLSAADLEEGELREKALELPVRGDLIVDAQLGQVWFTEDLVILGSLVVGRGTELHAPRLLVNGTITSASDLRAGYLHSGSILMVAGDIWADEVIAQDIELLSGSMYFHGGLQALSVVTTGSLEVREGNAVVTQYIICDGGIRVEGDILAGYIIGFSVISDNGSIYATDDVWAPRGGIWAKEDIVAPGGLSAGDEIGAKRVHTGGNIVAGSAPWLREGKIVCEELTGNVVLGVVERPEEQE